MTPALSQEDLNHFQHRLRERERQLLDELRAGGERIQEESFPRVAGEAPDNGDASFADTVLDTVNAERKRDFEELREVQEALNRIDAGTYGLCLTCGKPIDRRRLEASPFARYDVEHQSQQERPALRTPTL